MLIRIISLIEIYSDIHSYEIVDMNIFGYLSVSFLGNQYSDIHLDQQKLGQCTSSRNKFGGQNKVVFTSQRHPHLLSK